MNFNLVQNGYGFEKGYTPWNKGGENIVKKCLICNKEFEVFHHRKDAKYCSFQCNGRAGKGRKKTLKAIENISRAKQGENNPMWNGGTTPIRTKIWHSKEYQEWRTAVFERDNYTCVWCGDDKSGNLNADHIKPFALYIELRFVITNGRTLCVQCHKQTPTYGNRRKN